ncbi:hypothetical protein EDB19DRAFT_1588975, partial [Suillus lakei]
AYNPIGESCDTPGAVGCGQADNFNGGNSFICECASDDIIEFSVSCGCSGCCTEINGGAYC